MYQLLLTKRYLSSKIMPLLAALAVALCTAMVIIVWSVMGGFLVMLINSGRTLVGDVSISWPVTGFAHYEDLIKRLEADPEIAGATPMIETYGLIGLPDGRTETVQVRGIDGPSFAKVTEWNDILYWRPKDAPDPKDIGSSDMRLRRKEVWQQIYEGGKKLTRLERSKGLRAACAAAQRLAWGAGLPALPIDTLMAVAEDARTRVGAIDVWVAMDARMGEVYAGRYRWSGSRWRTLEGPALCAPDALAARIAAQPAAWLAGSAARAMSERLTPASTSVDPQAQPAARALLACAEAAWSNREAIGAAAAAPLYLRDRVALTTAEREAAARGVA